MARDARGIVSRLGGQGHGVLDLADGTRAYVPHVLPGEAVAVVLGKPRGDGVAAALRELEQASPERVEPLCPHFMACGGCALQHWADAPYQAWKRGLLVKALERRDFTAPPVSDLVAMPAGSRRRADLVFRKAGARLLLGFHEAESHRIVDVESCAVLRPELVALLSPLRQGLAAALPDGAALDAKITLAENGFDMVLTGKLRLTAAARQSLAELAGRLGIVRLSLRQTPDAAPETLAQSAVPQVAFGPVRVALPPGGFLQAVPEAEDVLYALIAAELPAGKTGRASARIADLFSGCGAFAARLAAAGHAVLACDADAGAISALQAAANAQGLAGRLRAERRDLERRPLQAAELAQVDLLVLDPPRAGARGQIQALAEAARQGRMVPVVAYVACDPNSFARDARVLADAGYHLAAITPVDQFLWTPHLELVAIFRPSAAAAAGAGARRAGG